MNNLKVLTKTSPRPLQGRKTVYIHTNTFTLTKEKVEISVLKGKVALITGAATAIGRATALRLAKEDVHVTINYSRSEQEARETQKEVEALGVQSLCERNHPDVWTLGYFDQ